MFIPQLRIFVDLLLQVDLCFRYHLQQKSFLLFVQRRRIWAVKFYVSAKHPTDWLGTFSI